MRTPSLLLALVLSLASCGGAADPKSHNEQGYQALNSGKHAEAASHFESALAALGSDTKSDQYLRAALGLVEANVNVNPEKARDDFLALARANSSSIGAEDYSRIGGMLANAKKCKPALDVVDAGIKAFPETPQLAKLIEKITADCAGDAETMSALEGLGYLGDN
jgi:hypothetical protein